MSSNEGHTASPDANTCYHDKALPCLVWRLKFISFLRLSLSCLVVKQDRHAPQAFVVVPKLTNLIALYCKLY